MFVLLFFKSYPGVSIFFSSNLCTSELVPPQSACQVVVLSVILLLL